MATLKPVWFITGASSGIGYGIAVEALGRGHTVVATARNPDKITDLRDAGAHTLALDVTAPPSTIESIAREVERQFGRVDYLICAVEYLLEAAVEEATPEEAQAQFDTNVFGATNVIRAFLPRLRTQPTHPDTGVRATIATFGSLASWREGPSYAFYAMTKACMSLLAESLRGELATFNITVTVIEPGYFRTGFLRPGAGAHVQPQRRMDVYEDPNSTTGKIRQTLQAVAGNQPGDPKKGTKVCVDVLTRTGVAEGKDAVPARIVLGTDCEQVIRSQCQAALSYLDEWGPMSTNSYSPQDTTLLPSGSGLLKRYPPALDQSPNESFDLARARGILLATPLVRTTTNSTIVGIHHASTTIIPLAMSTPPNESDSSIIFFKSPSACCED